MTESAAVRLLLDQLSATHRTQRPFLLTEYCDAHLDDNDADNDASIYAAARSQLLRLRNLINSGDDLDSGDILHQAQLLSDIDSFITDESR